MKKIMFVLMAVLVVLLSSCGFREYIKRAPAEWEAPEGTLIAVCTVEDDVFTYLYQLDGVYRFYINDVMQGDNEIDNIQEQAYLLGESMDNYLKDEYTIGQCVIDDYNEDNEYSFD